MDYVYLNNGENMSHQYFFSKNLAISRARPRPSIFLMSTSAMLFYFFLGLLTMGSLVSFVHEMGHGLVVLLFDGKINEIVVFPIPYFIDSDLKGGYIHYNGIYTPQQKLLIHMAGSLSTLFFGAAMMYIIVKFHLRPEIEFMGMMYSLMLLFDYIFYVISDLLSLQYTLITDIRGDWEKVYLIFPLGRYIMPTFSILFLIFVIWVLTRRDSHTYFNY